MKKIFLVPVILTLLFCTANLSASYSCGKSLNQCGNNCAQESCCWNLCDSRGDIGAFANYSMGKSVGIDENYGVAGVYYIPELCPCGVGPVVELDYVYFGDGNYGAAAEVGVRFLDPTDTVVIALSGLYEYRHGDHYNFNQAGATLAFIGNCFEVVANGYFPLGTREGDSLERVFDDYDNTATDTPYQARVYSKEYALTGFDLEAGFRYSMCGFTTYTGVGTYYFKNKHYFDEWGALGRLELSYGRFITLGGQVSWDEHNDVEGRGVLELNIPLEMLCNFCSALCPTSKSQRRTHRDRTVHIEKCCTYQVNY